MIKKNRFKPILTDTPNNFILENNMGLPSSLILAKGIVDSISKKIIKVSMEIKL